MLYFIIQLPHVQFSSQNLKYFSDLLSGRLCMILHICVSLFFISLFSNVTHPSSLIISVTLAMSRLDKRRESGGGDKDGGVGGIGDGI